MGRERWLITGVSGQLGGHVVRQLAADPAEPEILALAGRGDVGTPSVAVRRIDLRDAAALRAMVAHYRPTQVIHAGAMTSVADAYAQPAEAWKVNVDATEALADAAEHAGARFVFTSTDMVFGGDAAPYRESDATGPLSQYGRSKVAAERVALERARALVVRLPLMFGLAVTQRATTFAGQVAALRAGKTLRLFADEYRTPLWLADAARALIGLARSLCDGLIHVAGPQRLSRFELLEAVAQRLGIAHPALERISRTEVESPEPRPADLSLDDTAFRAAFPALRPRAIAEISLT